MPVGGSGMPECWLGDTDTTVGEWHAWQDSNPQPLGPKPSALSIELQAHDTMRCDAMQYGAGAGNDPSKRYETERNNWGEQRDSNP